jgi:hypothetical protein
MFAAITMALSLNVLINHANCMLTLFVLSKCQVAGVYSWKLKGLFSQLSAVPRISEGIRPVTITILCSGHFVIRPFKTVHKTKSVQQVIFHSDTKRLSEATFTIQYDIKIQNDHSVHAIH